MDHQRCDHCVGAESSPSRRKTQKDDVKSLVEHETVELVGDKPVGCEVTASEEECGGENYGSVVLGQGAEGLPKGQSKNGLLKNRAEDQKQKNCGLVLPRV